MSTPFAKHQILSVDFRRMENLILARLYAAAGRMEAAIRQGPTSAPFNNPAGRAMFDMVCEVDRAEHLYAQAGVPLLPHKGWEVMPQVEPAFDPSSPSLHSIQSVSWDRHAGFEEPKRHAAFR